MRRVLRGGFIAIVCIVVGVALYGYREIRADRSLPVAETAVIVPKGALASQTSRQLAREGVIASPLLFDLLVRVEHAGDRIRAGQFRFAAHESLEEVLRELITGGRQVAVWVTIPEGFTARETAATLAAHNLGTRAVFDRLFAHGSISLYGVRTRSLEGFLFPSTYLIPLGSSPQVVARQFIDQFLAELPPDAGRRAERLGLTVPQVVTLASLIEREAKADDERRLMAGVYYNRLRRGMPLEVDATIEYIFPKHKDVITLADLARDSPYNTYKHMGLPPTPIAAPGRASLRAAFDPQASDYLYYVYKGNGHHAFSRTFAEHQAAAARYLR
jgi:UPF0755 protein